MIFRIATIALLTHIYLTPEVYANSSAHTSSSISNRIAEREAKLEAQYFELFNTEDLTYLENDPICKTFRTQEKMAYTKEQIQKQIEKGEIEDRILNACKENTWDKISNTVGHIVEAGKEAVLLENMTDSAVERATHWALSQNAYEILMYPDLDQILKTKCYSGNDYLIPYFKAELIKN
ncbi:MAG: hypothetical protein KDD38_01935, partial [Bdellovibrionales bacterium]|nr:hypothetical protein [Bdellovibrionales bacterium]